ncbi:MlaD family protein [Leptothoe sp. PORK10 BA2]|uniref:MlaD family protein n=1 Tax=Leptothoe sp. PORK10 BA2 TaxID=3110254 RepID=UPI002B1F3707|nr:MlaD family protein [Leptothoe sp. PORK10 BA2]MEA5464248.1 MlaD family protein [Leptothoe sp. PORK10 BA2]
MRARTIREGSVGLLILAGVVLFGGLVMWLRGVSYGQSSYRLLVDFESAVGLQEGSSVMYRGVPVGQITKISPGSDAVTVTIQINQGELRIPAQSVIKTSQSGLIGETTISIQPPLETSVIDQAIASPMVSQCNSALILCDGDRLDGVVGVNYEDLLESSQKISEALADPEILAGLQDILDNTRQISGNFVDLTKEFTLAAGTAREEIKPLSASTQQTLLAVSAAADQLESSTFTTSAQLDTTLTQVNAILATNQDNLAITLDNISASTGQLRLALDTLSPVIQEGTLVDNVELLAANAAIASEDLRDISASLNTSENLVLLQQTIESARDVFQSAQKIMADVDTLTGDPALRGNVRNLLNGLSELVSSTSELESQTEVAEQLNEQIQIVENLETMLAESESDAAPSDAPVLRYNGERYVTDLATEPKQ